MTNINAIHVSSDFLSVKHFFLYPFSPSTCLSDLPVVYYYQKQKVHIFDYLGDREIGRSTTTSFTSPKESITSQLITWMKLCVPG